MMAPANTKEVLPDMEQEDCAALDLHKDYSVFHPFAVNRKVAPVIRVNHENEELDRFLKTLRPGMHVGFEACGSWM
jgi:hypothetical protein